MEEARNASPAGASRVLLMDGDGPLYIARARARGAAEAIPHAIFGRVFEPELTLLPPDRIAPGLGQGQLSVRALDQLVVALTG